MAPIPSGDSASRAAEPSRDATPTVAQPAAPAHPTNHLHNIRVAEGGLHILATTEAHLYDARDVEIMQDGVECVGTMSDETIQELWRTIAARGGSRVQQTPTGVTSAASRFSGGGHTLGNIGGGGRRGAEKRD
ncbi:hypothetical protein BX600DRAFT_119246 [Xylariales sp. PMI_506]|nr:hypothetical protein BX600DRAFT_119246 [Xylariales sp. PMI_506]